MVLNYEELKQRHYPLVHSDIAAVRQAVPSKITLKVILETSQLTKLEIVAGSLIAKEAGANFVKTSTGFNGPGAVLGDVAMMRAVVGPGVGVKASGGIRDYSTARRMLNAGANRLGTSSGVDIVRGSNKDVGGGRHEDGDRDGSRRAKFPSIAATKGY